MRIPQAFFYVGAVLSLALCLPIGPVHAGPTDGSVVLIADSNEVSLQSGDDGATVGSIALENQTADVVPLAISSSRCSVVADPRSLDPLRHQTVKLTFPEACRGDDRSIAFTVDVGNSEPFALTTKTPTAATPSWLPVFLSYVVSFIIAVAVLQIAWAKWQVPHPMSERAQRSKDMPLPGLEAGWKFSDSWAANATVITALFTGVFAVKEVVTELLGDAASKDLIAVGVVCAAASVGLAGLSPMILQVMRKRHNGFDPVRDGGKDITKGTPPGYYVTPRGLVWAGVATLTATGGQLGAVLVTLWTTTKLNELALAGALVILASALAIYGYGATQQNLFSGATLVLTDEGAAAARASARSVADATRDRINSLDDRTSVEVLELINNLPSPQLYETAPALPAHRPAAIL